MADCVLFDCWPPSLQFSRKSARCGCVQSLRCMLSAVQLRARTHSAPDSFACTHVHVQRHARRSRFQNTGKPLSVCDNKFFRFSPQYPCCCCVQMTHRSYYCPCATRKDELGKNDLAPPTAVYAEIPHPPLWHESCYGRRQ